jgi:hypothetical protein
MTVVNYEGVPKGFVWDIINVSVTDSTTVLLVLEHLFQLTNGHVVAFGNLTLTSAGLAVQSVLVSISTEMKIKQRLFSPTDVTSLCVHKLKK